MKENVVSEVWDALKGGAEQRKHPLHLLNLAYVGEGAECCTVVLREIQDKRLRFHTHIGASKVRAMKQDPRVCLMGYDTKTKMQLRLKGEVEVSNQTPETKAIWENMQSSSKLCYQLPAPGDNHPYQGSMLALSECLQKDQWCGYEQMAICWVNLKIIDVMILHYSGHFRCLIDVETNQVSKIQA